ncbi:MAG: ribosome maturation factor RimM [Rickettsiales bacterium]|jgi:16S rRNA processing protein RimM|nr:ribosome maturation factor RimM [Rickettsiales bacterium]
MLKIGKILSSHGLGGNVRVISFFENPEDIFRYRIADAAGNIFSYRKVGSNSRKNVFLLKFDHINSIDEAKKWTGVELFTDSEVLPPLSADEIYLEDLVGMSVVDDHRQGTIDSLANYGAGDILEIIWNSGEHECVIYSENLVKSIDKKNNTISIYPPYYI